jgi:hypothetical protein
MGQFFLKRDRETLSDKKNNTDAVLTSQQIPKKASWNMAMAAKLLL